VALSSTHQQRNRFLQEHQDVLKNWTLPPIKTIEEIAQKRVYHITLEDQSVYTLKCIEPNDQRRCKRLAFEHDVIAHLYQADVPVAKPIQNRLGKTYTTYNNSLYILSTYLEHDQGWGQSVPNRDFNMGQAIATLHEALFTYPIKDFGFEIWENRPGYEMLEKTLPTSRAHLSGPDLDIVEHVANTTPENYIQTIDQLETQLIHRDLHGGNILVKGSQITGFIDCDHISIGPRIYDLAYLGGQTIRYAHGSPEEADNWCHFISQLLCGYATSSKAAITQQERQLFPFFIREVVLMFVSMRSKNSKGPLPLETELSALKWMNEHIEHLQVLVQENFVS